MRAEPEVADHAALPLMVRVIGRRCAVVGGGSVGTRRAERLAKHGAEVIVISPEITSRLAELHESGAIAALRRRPYTAGDLEGCLMAVAATAERDVNARVAADARAAGILCNVADVPAEGDVIVPAGGARGRLTLSVATAGAGPVAAATARDRALAALGPGWEPALDLLAELRAELIARYPDPVDRRDAVGRLLAPASLEALSGARDRDRDGLARSALGLGAP